MSTRPARPDDSEFAYEVRRAALGPYVEQLWGWNDVEQRERHALHFAEQRGEIVEWDGQDVGVIKAARAADAWLLHQLFLLPAYQGQGIGSACMARLIAQARHAGVPIRLQVLKVNARALAFYLRFGFVQVGATDTHVLLGLSL